MKHILRGMCFNTILCTHHMYISSRSTSTTSTYLFVHSSDSTVVHLFCAPFLCSNFYSTSYRYGTTKLPTNKIINSHPTPWLQRSYGKIRYSYCIQRLQRQIYQSPSYDNCNSCQRCQRDTNTNTSWPPFRNDWFATIQYREQSLSYHTALQTSIVSWAI